MRVRRVTDSGVQGKVGRYRQKMRKGRSHAREASRAGELKGDATGVTRRRAYRRK